MYKVFVNDSPIILTSSLENANNFPTYLFTDIIFEDVLKKLDKKSIKGINLISKNLEKDWTSFLKNLRVVPAAGGLVLNGKKQTLFIYRNNVWDLPKGRIEKGESIKTAAIREVEEECGIFNITIKQKLTTTYHIYFQNNLLRQQKY